MYHIYIYIYNLLGWLETSNKLTPFRAQVRHGAQPDAGSRRTGVGIFAML